MNKFDIFLLVLLVLDFFIALEGKKVKKSNTGSKLSLATPT